MESDLAGVEHDLAGPSWGPQRCAGATGTAQRLACLPVHLTRGTVVCLHAEPAATPASNFPQDYLERVKQTHQVHPSPARHPISRCAALCRAAPHHVPTPQPPPAARCTARSHAWRFACLSDLAAPLRGPALQHGGYGSIGYGYDWKIVEAEKNLLRTHTTAVSSRMLYRLAQVGPRGCGTTNRAAPWSWQAGHAWPARLPACLPGCLPACPSPRPVPLRRRLLPITATSRRRRLHASSRLCRPSPLPAHQASSPLRRPSPLPAHHTAASKPHRPCAVPPLSPSLSHHVQDGFRPAKYFSIDRVFRNEAIDRTHLAEFHQIEGGWAGAASAGAGWGQQGGAAAGTGWPRPRRGRARLAGLWRPCAPATPPRTSVASGALAPGQPPHASSSLTHPPPPHLGLPACHPLQAWCATMA